MPGPTPRQRAREETLARIKDLALAQLAESGAGELSLRAIARELNIVSSAIYRYYRSRDELITALIIDAYDDLGSALEAGLATGRRAPRRRWHDGCVAMRSWARAQPHRFALIYGSAIPGYRAPDTTIEPAARVLRAFAAPVVDAQPVVPGELALGRALRSQLVSAGTVLETGPDERVTLGLVGAFARVVGAVSLELGGHFVGSFEPADELYAALVEQEAGLLGLR